MDSQIRLRRLLVAHETSSEKVLLTCGIYVAIFVGLCVLAVCIAKRCQPPSASDQQVVNNHNPNRAAKKSKQAAEEVLTALPEYTYVADQLSPAPAQTACSICLGDYQDGERLRLLPNCGHVFHKGCVDRWLSGRSSTCPICRDQAVAATAAIPNVAVDNHSTTDWSQLLTPTLNIITNLL